MPTTPAARVTRAAITPQTITGGINCSKLIPPDFMTVISLSLDKRPKASNTARRKAMGIVNTRKDGMR